MSTRQAAGPGDKRFPVPLPALCPSSSVCLVFSLVSPLPSAICSGLGTRPSFAGFLGTMELCDSSIMSMSALWPRILAQLPDTAHHSRSRRLARSYLVRLSHSLPSSSLLPTLLDHLVSSRQRIWRERNANLLGAVGGRPSPSSELSCGCCA